MIAQLAGTLAVATAFVALAPAAASAATIDVDILTDEFGPGNNSCSLREAVQAANTNSNAHELGCQAGSGAEVDTVSLGNGEHELTIAFDGTQGINDGDLEITDAAGLRVLGTGRSTTQIDANDFDRIFEVTAGPLTVEALSARNGTAGADTFINGGGILFNTNAALTLQDARLADNNTGAGGRGGGIQITGTATVILNNSVVELNTSQLDGGGINASSGAAVVVNGPSQVRQNTALAQGGGINVSTSPGGDIVLNPGAVVDDNNAVSGGAGISNLGGFATSDVIVNGATVSNNDVTETLAGSADGGGIEYENPSGGQLQLTNAQVFGNTVTGDKAAGGGISINVSTGGVSIIGSAIFNNQSIVENDAVDTELRGGGGISLSGTGPMTITESTIGPNIANVADPGDTAVGGGIHNINSNLTLDRSTVIGNDISGGTPSNRTGAGVYVQNPSGPTRIINSTFSGNTLGGSGVGGGIAANLAQNVTIAHTTFALNTAGLAEAMNIFGAGGTFTLRGSVIDEGPNGCFPDPLAGVNGFNVDADDSCVGTTDDTDLENTAPLLGPPTTANGGPTATHALLAGSPAINLVPTAGTGCDDLAAADLTVDQRGAGFARPEPAGGNCDAGSFEVQDTDNDGVLDTSDSCPNQVGPASNAGCPLAVVTPITPVTPTTSAAENPQCAALRAKLKKAKSKKKKKKIRKQLRRLGC